MVANPLSIRDQAFLGKPIDVPVIDAHTHIMRFTYNGAYQSFSSTHDVVSLMDHLGIDGIVTAPHSLCFGDMAMTNESTVEAARQFPGKIFGYIVVRPQQGLSEVKATLKRYAPNPVFVGLKFLASANYHGPLACPEYDCALDFAAEQGCPVLCHTWANNPSMTEIEQAVKKRPHLKLMMAHQGGGSAEQTDRYVQLMSDYSNLYMEICGSLYNRYSIEDLVEKAGEDRVIYGSDLINLDPRFDLGRVIFSTLPNSVLKKLLAENFLGLLEGSAMGKIRVRA